MRDDSDRTDCEVIWCVVGAEVDSIVLASVSSGFVVKLAESFGQYFEIEARSMQQIETAIERNLRVIYDCR